MAFATQEAYLAAAPDPVRERLERIRAEVEARVPDAVRCIGYNMPAFRKRRIFFYFAGFKRHIGVYPPLTADPVLVEETARFRGPKGNLSFPLDEPLPIELIGRVAVALAVQYG